MKRTKVLIITALLAVLLLAVEVILVKKASSYEPKVKVVYAKARIPAGTVITEDMLVEKAVDISFAHKLSVRNLKDAAGKISRIDIEENEMLLSSRLEDGNEAFHIKVLDGENRLFTVEFKGDQANGWHIEEGQYVDIIFVPNERSGMNNTIYTGTRSDGRTVQGDGFQSGNVVRLENIRVAAVIDERGNIVGNNNKYGVPKYISFEVNKWQDEFLAYAKSNGRLELSLIPK